MRIDSLCTPLPIGTVHARTFLCRLPHKCTFGHNSVCSMCPRFGSLNPHWYSHTVLASHTPTHPTQTPHYKNTPQHIDPCCNFCRFCVGHNCPRKLAHSSHSESLPDTGPGIDQLISIVPGSFCQNTSWPLSPSSCKVRFRPSQSHTGPRHSSRKRAWGLLFRGTSRRDPFSPTGLRISELPVETVTCGSHSFYLWLYLKD